MKLKIGLDIDNTMFHLDVVEKVSSLYNLTYTSSQVNEWDHSNSGLPGFFTRAIKRMYREPSYMGSLQPFPGVLNKVKYWKSQGHELYVITARRDEIYYSTMQMLNMHFGSGFFDRIYFVDYNNPSEKKIYFWEKLALDMWVDDNPNDIREALLYTKIKKVFAISNEYTKYNRKTLDYLKNDKSVSDRLIEVSNLSEINLDNYKWVD
jgi:FMN phosphatase YigB (HAD superfamily)